MRDLQRNDPERRVECYEVVRVAAEHGVIAVPRADHDRRIDDVSGVRMPTEDTGGTSFRLVERNDGDRGQPEESTEAVLASATAPRLCDHACWHSELDISGMCFVEQGLKTGITPLDREHTADRAGFQLVKRCPRPTVMQPIPRRDINRTDTVSMNWRYDPMLAIRVRTAALVGGAAAMLAIAVPALAATTVSQTLSDYRIRGASSAKPGSVTFKVKNAAEDKHELIVIKTATKAASLKVSADGEASEKGRRGRVTVAGGQTKSLKLTLAKGHYALICNIGDHYTAGMRKDFTVR